MRRGRLREAMQTIYILLFVLIQKINLNAKFLGLFPSEFLPTEMSIAGSLLVDWFPEVQSPGKK
jgi:hypothetical protein